MKRILTLLLVMILLVACSNKEGKVELKEVKNIKIDDFVIDICGTKVTNEDLKTYPLYSGKSNTINSQGNSSSYEYVGYKLSDILKVTQVTDDIKEAQIICTDAYEMTFEGDLKADGILIAISKNGESFKDGPWFAPLTSNTTGDFAKDLASIKASNVSSPLAIEEENKEEIKQEIEFPQEPVCEDKTDKINFGPFCFKINGKEIKNDDLQGLKIYRITVTTKNAKDVVNQNKYSGYVLKDVLNKLDIQGSIVKTLAIDGYETTLSEEMINSDLTIIAIEKDKEIGKDGSVWLAPCKENTSGVYVKEVVEIIVE